MLPLRKPSNEAEFVDMMRGVDQRLRESNVPPHARPLRGWLEISTSLKAGLRICPDQNRDPTPGSYGGDDLTIRIFRWFDKHYGDRLQINFGPGRLFILLRHDPWMISLPKVFGTVVFFASATEPSSDVDVDLRSRQVPRLNVVDLLDGVTDSLKSSLNPQELSEILDHVVLGFRAMSALEKIRHIRMAPEVQSDIEAAVQHAMAQVPHYGQSKWSSLQAAEKILKIFLAARKVKFPMHHRLEELVSRADASGLAVLDRRIVDAIQCSGGIRYGEEVASLNEAYAAHVGCLQVVAHAAAAVQPAA